MNQKTIDAPITIEGIGLHGGQKVKMTLKPAAANTGIVFKRVDLDGQPDIPARYDHVIDTRMCTLIGTSKENSVSTTEHLMAALYVVGIDNLLIEINSPEVPLMDGSAKPFLDHLSNTSLKDLEVNRKYLRIDKKITFKDEKGIEVFLSPSTDKNLCILNEIDYKNSLIGKQSQQSKITKETFEKEIAAARTFGCFSEHEQLKKMGLARGASLDNVLVYTEDGKVMNEGGLRFKNEFARHKVLDSVGDLYMSGYRIIGNYENKLGGHYHNNQILRILFSNPQNYSILEK